jgi:predicted lactoylglutathione lyase
MKKPSPQARLSIAAMARIDTITLEVADPAAARRFYAAAFRLGPELQLRAANEPTSGFRGFTLSLTVANPATVRHLFDAAVAAGAAVLKPVKKTFWGVGGVVQAPDGTIWKLATPNKKDDGPATRDGEKLVLLLGVDDVAATKRFYAGQGLKVARSFGRKYAEFDTGTITLGLYGRRALAKDAGVAAEGSGAHCLVIGGGPFTDPDGFAWEPASDREPQLVG